MAGSCLARCGARFPSRGRKLHARRCSSNKGCKGSIGCSLTARRFCVPRKKDHKGRPELERTHPVGPEGAARVGDLQALALLGPAAAAEGVRPRKSNGTVLGVAQANVGFYGAVGRPGATVARERLVKLAVVFGSRGDGRAAR
jgi:hypothetical protein